MTLAVSPDSLLGRIPAEATAVHVEAGLSAHIDRLSERAPVGYRFLRRGWYRAALEAYHGGAEGRTVLAFREGRPVAALPLISVNRIARVPGSYWPFRSFPVAADCTVEDMTAMLRAKEARKALGPIWRLGPVYEDDRALHLVRQAAAAAGWTPVKRDLTRYFLLDIEGLRSKGKWPRTSTLQKNRYIERKLAASGELEWHFESGEAWTTELFDRLAAIEAYSAVVTDGEDPDAKFLGTPHRVFWEAAAADPELARQMTAAILSVGGKPVAFSFDLNDGPHKFIVANAFDGRYSDRSPGRVLAYRNFARSMDEDGLQRVDWGAGDSGYKSQAGAEAAGSIQDYLFVRGPLLKLVAPLLGKLWSR